MIASNPVRYIDEGLDIETCQVLSQEDSIKMANYILANARFRNSHYNKDGSLSKKRNKLIYGEIPSYQSTYQGRTVETPILPWSDLPLLLNLKNIISGLTKQRYNVCVIQLYNNGQVGIEPHRDKEMDSNVIIASVSLGTTRIMRFDSIYEINGEKKRLDIPLNSGMLCLLKPPTNDRWLHSIPKDNSTTYRISLVFRLVLGDFEPF